MDRIAVCERKTLETYVRVELNLDGSGTSEIKTGYPFFDHMLETLSKHSSMDLKVSANALKMPNVHHIVEDVALTIGEALNKSLGDRKGIRRFGFAIIPMDDALAEVSLDISGRPYLHVEGQFVGFAEGLDFNILKHFLRSLAQSGRLTIHVSHIYGEDAHHVFEALFKALALALREACKVEAENRSNIQSTKGVLI
ncbi:MAG: imidazoleglycerol-phosphate dehydratase HisB [Candidatus Bathyarchaeia archaeon]